MTLSVKLVSTLLAAGVLAGCGARAASDDPGAAASAPTAPQASAAGPASTAAAGARSMNALRSHRHHGARRPRHASATSR